MKKLFRTFAILLMCAVISGSIGVQAYAYSPLTDSNTASISPSPQSDIIEWRYEVENGKLYKRQYNCTQGEWIGSWILVG
jgi:hypothetical protein